jgi:pimeloyl-ACP methyl ester carboxylesterase
MATIEINGCQVGLIRQGRGQPVVLLHGSGATGGQWRALIDTLSTGFLVLAPDLYGYGGTGPWPGHHSYSLSDEADLVHALLDDLAEPAHVVGHSYGAATAMHMARMRTGGLRSLTLVEPAAFHLLRDGDEADLLALNEFISVGSTMTQALCQGEFLRGFGSFVDYWNGPGTWAALPLEKRAAMARALPKVMLEFHATTTHPARIGDFSGIAAPTLLLQGSRTTLPARRVCRRLIDAWPHAQVETIAGAGHMSPLTHRELVNTLITAHVLANAGARPRARAACS